MKNAALIVIATAFISCTKTSKPRIPNNGECFTFEGDYGLKLPNTFYCIISKGKDGVGVCLWDHQDSNWSGCGETKSNYYFGYKIRYLACPKSCTK